MNPNVCPRFCQQTGNIPFEVSEEKRNQNKVKTKEGVKKKTLFLSWKLSLTSYQVVISQWLTSKLGVGESLNEEKRKHFIYWLDLQLHSLCSTSNQWSLFVDFMNTLMRFTPSSHTQGIEEKNNHVLTDRCTIYIYIYTHIYISEVQYADMIVHLWTLAKQKLPSQEELFV